MDGNYKIFYYVKILCRVLMSYTVTLMTDKLKRKAVILQLFTVKTLHINQ